MPPHERRRQQRNPWTRLPKYDEEFNGRLALGAPAGTWYQHSYSYSDVGRWTLGSRLGLLLQDLESLAAEAERREREQELREAELRGRWYAAVARAREQQIGQHRANGLIEQVRTNLAAGRRDPCLLLVRTIEALTSPIPSAPTQDPVRRVEGIPGDTQGGAGPAGGERCGGLVPRHRGPADQLGGGKSAVKKKLSGA